MKQKEHHKRKCSSEKYLKIQGTEKHVFNSNQKMNKHLLYLRTSKHQGYTLFWKEERSWFATRTLYIFGKGDWHRRKNDKTEPNELTQHPAENISTTLRQFSLSKWHLNYNERVKEKEMFWSLTPGTKTNFEGEAENDFLWNIRRAIPLKTRSWEKNQSINHQCLMEFHVT